jgi:hypothetical protein
MARRTRDDLRRAIIQGWEPADAVREALDDAISGARAAIARYSLCRTHVVQDDNGDPIGGVLVWCPVRGGSAIAAATAGDLVADAALRAGARDIRSRRRKLPAELAAYMRATKRRGNRARAERNAAIVWAVETLRDRYGFKPSPQAAKPEIRGRISACWIVAAVLSDLGEPTTEKAVLRIWDDRKSGRVGSPSR